MTRTQAAAQAQKEAAARIGHRTAELLVECPHASIDDCLLAAALEDALIHGTPNGLTPRGFLTTGAKRLTEGA
jgi:hypothetical protein